MLAPVFGALAHEGGFGLGKGPVILDPIEIWFLSVSVPHRPPRAVFEDEIQFGPRDFHRPFASGSAGDITEQLIEKLIELPPHIIDGKWCREQPDAAIDVESHAAGGNHALFEICRRDAPDAEAITLMSIGHGKRTTDKAPERCDIRYLILRLIPLNLFDELIIGIDETLDVHPGLVRLRYDKAIMIDLL
jgi:hypothetical protein